MIEHAMNLNKADRFAEHLRRGNRLPQPDAVVSSDVQGIGRGLTKLWEASSLSASDFANEAEQFSNPLRIELPDLLAASSLARQFSRRFLREPTMLRFQSPAGKPCLAVADPGDTAAAQA